MLALMLLVSSAACVSGDIKKGGDTGTTTSLQDANSAESTKEPVKEPGHYNNAG